MTATAPHGNLRLPRRRGERPLTRPHNPHQQLTQNPDVRLQEALWARMATLDGVLAARSTVSLPDTRALHLHPDLAHGPEDAFLAGTEFAHLHGHADGSLHLRLLELLGNHVIRQVVVAVDSHASARPLKSLRVRVVRRYPHDTSAFTQGLLWHDGHLYESTGLRGRSTLRKVQLETGEVLERRDVDRAHFAEGLALVRDRLIQLTWRSGLAHVWSVDGFRHQGTIEYDGEGWGLCYDGQHLVMSDGSARLTFRDPETFREVRHVTVRKNGRAVPDLNELECVDGAVWANVWQSDEILRIDPANGRVTGVVDASGLLTDSERRRADVLNGIAWIPERNRFVITGKNWPHLFEIELDPR